MLDHCNPNPQNIVKTYNYSYGDTGWKDKLTSFDGKAITYDEIGNPLTYNGYTFTWEEGRQLAGIEGKGLSISYKYNDQGIRTEKTVNGVTTKYYLLGDKVILETNGLDTIHYSYDSQDNLVSINLNGVEYYYVRNGQGDIIALIDANGNEVVTYTYDSWGNVISIDGSLKDTVGVNNPYRYRGYRYDEETKLYYLQSRFYNPEWGRFVNADAIVGEKGELLSHNMFAYCSNDPVNMEDKNGYFGIKSSINKINYVLIYVYTFIISRTYVIQQRINNKILEYIGKAFNKGTSKTINASNLKMSKTVQNHINDIIKKGPHKGELARPYIDSNGTTLLIDEIMQAGTPVKDTVLKNGLRWDVQGTFRGSTGTWELVIDTSTNTIVHFNFVAK